ncbi:hypothetical protein A2110_02260 [Candidatus Jorgensenbacteria bacterium GWA1_54_12]|uniref:Uncharacterized protein n=1 Tax=Candidatus Jorgensenbacteria bacterium GWA1_54_12 TaxID=1798468 RepID=A0A1F6BK71_9BACT|nr:MAG: hypothetical protein A2110_02260 [Candidatus Jorgensenbacteria bacterium GWA1_54_12]
MSRDLKKFILALFVFFMLLGTSGVAVYTLVLLKNLPPLEEFSARKVSQSTKIYDRTGEALLYELFDEEKRTVVAFQDIPDIVKNATITAEDSDFYHQPAFDWRGIARAILVNIREGRAAQGGSTITQQLVKNVFLTPERTITRKIKELALAIKLERQYEKDEILGAYLNQIPYGSNVYGVEAASRLYFGKSVKDVTVAEAATLAAILNRPSFYSPWGDHRDELLKRKDYVLERMRDFEFISNEEYEAAKAQEIQFEDEPSLGSIQAPHFSLAVKQFLIDRYGENMALRGGLKVVTTLDMELQEIAERVVAEGAARNEELYGGKNAALVAQDPASGEILALVGSRSYFDETVDGKFNAVTQGYRQPGSALKPFAYLTAFEKGFHPQSIVFDAETEFVSGSPDCPAIVTPESDLNPECFNPENFDSQFRGPVTLEEGLAQSINIPSVKVLYLAGFEDVLDTLHRLGITTLTEGWRYGLSLVLGGGEVRLIDLVNAYATLADEGTLHKQSFILRVEDSEGNIIDRFTGASSVAYSREPIRLINRILSDVGLRAGLFQSSLGLTVFPGYEVALKTGTTNDYRDAWAMGYTPHLAIGVWAGNNDNEAMHSRGSSILAAVPIWSAFLQEAFATGRIAADPFPRPAPASLPAKPMMNGQMVYTETIGNQVFPHLHSILYWVDKNNPLGPFPSSPYADSQFYNWETSVMEWAKLHIPGFESSYNRRTPEQGAAPANQNISIQFLNPYNGSFVSSPFIVRATVRAASGVGTTNLYLNRVLVHQQALSSEAASYVHILESPLEAQNVLELEVLDKKGEKQSSSIIIFRNQ